MTFLRTCVLLTAAKLGFLCASSALGQEPSASPLPPQPGINSPQNPTETNMSTGAVSEDDIPSEVLSSLPEYLLFMAEKLDFYFTLEESAIPSGTLPYIQRIKDFDANVEIATIDAFVAHLDATLQNVKVVRSKKSPKVVHLITENLLVDAYVMDREVTVNDFVGTIDDLPDRLGEILDGRIESKDGGSFPPLWGDGVTQVNVSADRQIVRDVLTAAVPLEGYERWLWEANQWDAASAVEISYNGAAPANEPDDE